jgi:acyl carrier protein
MSTLERIATILVENYKVPPDTLTADTLLEDIGVDSIGFAELLFDIEDGFNIKLPDEMVELTTLGDVVNYVDQVRSAAQTGSTLV